jgi:D-arabinose 1-dehydrogenase-like Zn-dependent alcohol dehydrogenase
MMATQKSLVLTSHDQPLSIQNVPIPTAVSGSIVVRVIATVIMPNHKKIINGEAQFPLSLPLVPGGQCIGRIQATGPDTTTLKKGKLVICSGTIRSRDDPEVSILLGIHNGIAPEARILAEGEWRNGTLAEYAKFPSENVLPLNEELLVDKMGYKLSQLSSLPACLVAFGGLDDLRVRPGDSVLVIPATGKFSGAAVEVALAMGAKVIAAGRNYDVLTKMQEAFAETQRLTKVVLTGDTEKDGAALKLAAGGSGADYYIDFSPPAAAKSTHIAAGISALKHGGKVSLMGGIAGNIEIPYVVTMFKDLQFRGKFMHDRDQGIQVIKMVETGLLKLGGPARAESFGPYGLEDIEEALDIAEKHSAWGSEVSVMP